MAEPLLAVIARVRTKLLARRDLFDVGEIEIEPPISVEELTAIATTVGVALPPLLRTHYTQVAAALSFRWDVRPGAFRDLGYATGLGADGDDEEDEDGHGQTPRGRIRVVHPSELGRARIAGLAQFTNADGDGWAIESAHIIPAGGETAIVWFDHDVPRAPRRVVYRSCEALFDALAADGFAVEGDAHGIHELLSQP